VAIRATQRSSQLHCKKKSLHSLVVLRPKLKRITYLKRKSVFRVESFFFVFFFLTNDKNITPNPKPYIKIYFIIMKKPKESPIIKEFKKT